MPKFSLKFLPKKFNFVKFITLFFLNDSTHPTLLRVGCGLDKAICLQVLTAEDWVQCNIMLLSLITGNKRYGFPVQFTDIIFKPHIHKYRCFQNFKMIDPTYTLTEYCYQKPTSYIHRKEGILKHCLLQA